VKLRLARRVGQAEARVVPVRADEAPPKARRAEVAGFAGRAGESCELVGRKRRLLLVGCGDGTLAALEAAGACAAARLRGAREVALDARGLPPEAACAFAVGFRQRAWRDDRWRTRRDPDEDALPERVRLVVDDRHAARPAWRAARAALAGNLLARALVTEPSNTLTPAGFVARLGPLRRAGVEIEVLDSARLMRDGFGALLAVGGASANAPCLAVLRWRGTLDQAPVAFVGKGITFDTGGVCVKPAAGMWEMRGDMAGAAACAGAMLALALRGSPAPAVAVLPLAENALGAASYRPGDVLRAVDGTTIEVVDTDAEGRLVLADALAWTAATLRPLAILDLATLTGSIIVALGHERAGLFGDALLGAHAAAAGEAVGEPLWPMPIGEGHRRALDSDIADLRHCSPDRRQPDACQAAAFLREFAQGHGSETPWVHLDIAGVESREDGDDRHAKGATGFGVRLLDHLVAARFEDPHRA
jgi:leucyl aminopeptidase